jgi:hypothetical protein
MSDDRLCKHHIPSIRTVELLGSVDVHREIGAVALQECQTSDDEYSTSDTDHQIRVANMVLDEAASENHHARVLGKDSLVVDLAQVWAGES